MSENDSGSLSEFRLFCILACYIMILIGVLIATISAYDFNPALGNFLVGFALWAMGWKVLGELDKNRPGG